MNINSTNSFIKDLNFHIININRTLKNIKLNVMADFIYVDNKGIIIITNNIVSSLDLQIIEKYVKSLVCINTEYVEFLRLPQSKLYLKIIGVLYLAENTNFHITFDDIKQILKSNHIFNNVVLTSKPKIIKVSTKSDMSIIQIDIQDSQSSSKAKYLINRKFNIGSFIATIQGANMNPGILQYKNCQKQNHSSSICRIQRAKYIKYNGPYQTIHYCEFTQCCKANNKTNPSKLEMKKSKLYLYTFKCLNCKEKHQADLTDYPFQKYHFNKEWHSML